MSHLLSRHALLRRVLVLGLVMAGSLWLDASNAVSYACDPPSAQTPTRGEFWSLLPDPYDSGHRKQIVALGTAPNGDLYAIGVGGVSVSSDGGQTWKIINNGLTNLLTLSIGFNSLGEPVVGVGNNTNIGVFRYTKGSWHQARGISANRYISAFTQDRTGALLAVTAWAGDVFRSTDNGDTFRKVAPMVGSTNGITAGALWVIHKAPDGTLFTGGELPEGLYRSPDNGTTWVPDGLSKEQGYIGNMMAITHNALNEIIAARTKNTGALLQRRLDTGWVASSTGLPGWGKVRGLVLTPANDLFVAVTGNNAEGAVYRSTDNGQTWKLCSTGLPTKLLGPMAADKSGVYEVVYSTHSIYKLSAAPAGTP